MGDAIQRKTRRQWLVNRPFQFRFVGVMFLFHMSLSIVFLASVFLALWWTLYTFELLHDPVAISLFTTAGWMVALELILLTPFVIWAGIRFSHRVAGPLVRILATLKRMAAGDVDIHIALRKTDELKEVADAINQLAASLRARKV